MAEIARQHHDAVQSDESVNSDQIVREENILKVLDSLETKLSSDEADMVGELVSPSEVLEAMRAAENGTAPGLDGIQHEVWKTLHERFIEDEHAERPSFNIVNVLHAAYIDIQTFGVSKGTGFSDGWMAPLYKKGVAATRRVDSGRRSATTP
ncbi:hypothetical protein BD310DRAFT_834204 [Dichomitus squalens]|uniref:Uncharacterized protein n=1 Tax=Dichomitus squalens TaxID=114155 RepID=A0A4Q9PAM2_9APHY|nr:hypothetical protein BD310DRAFT_834204 [Dichomitus squalens]